MKIGPILKLYRRRAGLDGKVLAQKAGVSASHLSRMENDVNPTSLDNLESICEVLGVAPWKVLKAAEDYAASVQPSIDALDL